MRKNQKNLLVEKILENAQINSNLKIFEDTKNSITFGQLLKVSLSNVETINLKEAIEKVIKSYGDINPKDEVLIQPMLTNVIRSGVAFTHDPNTCSPYRIINWSESSDTTEVTGGLSGKTWQDISEIQKIVISKNIIN